MNNEFDYIVVGAGSGGCALVNRLTERTDTTTLLIEAGREDVNPMIHIPRGFAKILDGETDMWRNPIDPSVKAPEMVWMRGEVLGGSSSVNGQVYMRGRPDDYDGLNVPGWGWDQVGKAFAEIESHELGAGPDRGANGPLRITIHPDHHAVSDALMEAVVANGAVATEDLNQEDGPAVGYQPRNVFKGRRQSAAVAFLNPVKSRPNLTIRTRTRVRRVVFEGNRAVGVEVKTADGATATIRARKEVVLCAGALTTPKLLMLSGIGPAATLGKYGIPVLVDTPQVGQNMTEQLCFIPTYRLKKGSENHKLTGLGLIKTMLQYVLFRSGPLSHAVFELSAFFKTTPGANRPDAMFQFIPASATIDKMTGSMVPEKLPGATFSAYLVRPKSRGYMTITSADPDAPAFFDPAYLTHPDDRKGYAEMVRRLREFVSHPALKPFGFEEVSPGPSVQTEEEIVEYCLTYGSYAVHALGTCCMGTDVDSVVDPELRVRGVEGLRIADISILPEMVSSHTNAPAMMIGWRAGQIISAAHAGR